MRPEVWTAALSPEQLSDWLAPPRTHVPFAILERLDDIDFPAAEEAIALERWSVGRVFGPDYELRWQQEGDRYRTWLAGVPPKTDCFRLLSLPDCLSPLEGSGYGYMWGPDEVRIGRRLDYRALPSGAGRPRLAWLEYRRPGDGALIFVRLTGMRRKETR